MASKKQGKYRYGDTQLDIQDELLRYSKANKCPVSHYADAICLCGNKTFRLLLDDDAGAAIRICNVCKDEHPIGDSKDFLEDAELAECECVCGLSRFEIIAAVALYAESEDVKWLYLGCRCSQCGLIGCYGDWSNEYIGFRELLNLV